MNAIERWQQRYPVLFRMIAEKPDPLRFPPGLALRKLIEAEGVDMVELIKAAAAYSKTVRPK